MFIVFSCFLSFSCSLLFPDCSLFFILVFIVFHYFSLFFFDEAQQYENGQDRIFSRSWRDMAPNYILGSFPLCGNACVLIFKICIYIIYIEMDVQIH